MADAEELDEAILEACADQADEAVDLAIEAILVADAEELDEDILEAGEAIEVRLEAKEFFELGRSKHSIVFRPGNFF